MSNGDGLVLASSATLANEYPSRCEGVNGNHMDVIYYCGDLIDNIS